MILTKDLAERAKALITTVNVFPNEYGVCRALWTVSENRIDLYNRPDSFWDAGQDAAAYRFPCTPEGDEKRRIFIDSLIGKDL